MALEATEAHLFPGKILWVREGQEPFELPIAPPDPDALQLTEAEARVDYYKRYKALLWEYQTIVQRAEQVDQKLKKWSKRSGRLFWVCLAMTVINFALAMI